MVEVCTSSIHGSGDGLRLRRDVEAGTVVAFYHGLRMKAADESPWGAPTGYGIMVEWDRDKKDTSDVLDLSPEVTCSLYINSLYNVKCVPTSCSPLPTTAPRWPTR